MKKNIYLDDVRTPLEDGWVVVRSYEEFVEAVESIGLPNLDLISLDHDLGDTAMQEYYNNVSPNYKLDYDNIAEKTGYDCAKWLVAHYYDNYNVEKSRAEKRKDGICFPRVIVHSANPIGSANIMGYINNFLMNEAQQQTCTRAQIPHSVNDKN
jgi:hypothetical protein